MDNAVPRVTLKRVNPFMGLMIDAPTWTDAHEYHRQASQAHSLAMHGWGIVSGLEVDAAEPADRSVWIRPGVALDPEGRIIIAAQPFRYQINTQEAGLIYLVLMYRDIESTTDRAISIEDGREYASRMLDAYAIFERDQLPDQPHVELARIQLSPGKKVVKDAAVPTAPKVDEIDRRYREQAGVRPGPRTTVGVWKPDEIADTLANHLAGPTRLITDLSSGVEWRLRRRDQPPTGEQPLDADLLMMPVHAKTSFTDAEKTQLTTFLDGGGVLLVEACASGAAGDTQKVIASVAQAVGRKPQPVKRDHPLLIARHVFSAPPPGAASGQLFEGDGLVLSTADYACAWNGGLADKGLDRGTIRAAVEFAENLLAYAQIRRGNARRAQRSERRG
ncbi:MAG TPA: DUF4159 domain-containing protein [Chloroflexia bacterium]